MRPVDGNQLFLLCEGVASWAGGNIHYKRESKIDKEKRCARRGAVEGGYVRKGGY
jgi:hypothetical protein